MEVKVWVEGIQRVVCGVSDVTTCQDIVIALAHATGKTGRFTLVERWRENERLVAPLEYPLKVLRNWGEYSSDVQFVLRHSPDKSRHRGGTASQNKPGGGYKRPHGDDKLLNKLIPLSDSHTKGVVKRNLTFSGAHHSTPPLGPGGPRKVTPVESKIAPLQRRVAPFENSSLDSVEEQSSLSSHSSSSPYSSFQSSSTGETVRQRGLPFGHFRPSEFSRITHPMRPIQEPPQSSQQQSSPIHTPTNSLERRAHAQRQHAHGNGTHMDHTRGGNVHMDHAHGTDAHLDHMHGGNVHMDAEQYDMNFEPAFYDMSNFDSEQYDMPAHLDSSSNHHKVLSASLPISQNMQHLFVEDKLSPRASPSHYLPNIRLHEHNKNPSKSNHSALVQDRLQNVSVHNELGQYREKGTYNEGETSDRHQMKHNSKHSSLHTNHQHHLHNGQSHNAHMRTDESMGLHFHSLPRVGDSNLNSHNHSEKSDTTRLTSNHRSKHVDGSSGYSNNKSQPVNDISELKSHDRPKSPHQSTPSSSPTEALLDSSGEVDENKNSKKSHDYGALLRGRSLQQVSRDDLVKLVNLQIERLNSQEEHMKQLDTDICEWEERDVESAKRLKMAEDELEAMQSLDRTTSDQIQELEIVSWADKLEMERQTEKRLRAELEGLQARMTSQGEQVRVQMEKAVQLEQQIEEERRAIERDKQALELKLQQEIAELEKQISEKEVEHGTSECGLEELAGEVKALESSILEKQTQVAALEEDLKHVNLQLFNTEPLDGEQEQDKEQSDEKCVQFSRSSSSRPGSSRVMPSTPAQLKDAIQAEPQGYWV